MLIRLNAVSDNPLWVVQWTPLERSNEMKKTLKLLVAPALLSSLMFVGCGAKKSSDDAPNSGNTNPTVPAKGTNNAPASVASEIDQRIFGVWNLLETPMTDDSTGMDVPGAVLRLSLSVTKDKLAMISESIRDGKITCTAKAEVTAFTISKKEIKIDDTVSKQSEIPGQKENCSVDLKKGSFGYEVVSDDSLKLTNSDGNESAIAKRIK